MNIRIAQQNIFYIILSVVFIFSCGRLDELKSPLEGFKIYVNYDIFDTFVSLRFVETATGELISESNVLATIGGTYQGAVVDQLGNSEESYTSVYGFMSLALNPKDPFVPAKDNVINFSIQTNAEGYSEQIVGISIDTVGIHNFTIYLEKESDIKRGVKKYVREIRLHNSALVDSFSLGSSGGEFSLSMPKNLKLLDINRATVIDTIATAELIVYTNLGRAPVTNKLVSNYEIGGSVEPKAFNPINIISFTIKTASGELNNTDGGIFDLTFGLNRNFINPLTGTVLASGDILPVCNYDKLWKQKTEQPIQENGDSLFVDHSTNHLSVFAVGAVQPVCDFSGNIMFNLSNEFPLEPIGARVSCYRERDNKHIGYIDYNLSQQSLSRDFSFNVPEDEEVVLRIRQKSTANGFTATPANISVQTPCNQYYQYNVDLASTSINFQGEVSFHFTEPFPKENFNVRVGFYRADNNRLLLSKVYNVSQDQKIFIETGVPANQKLYLKFSATNQDDGFVHSPEKIFIDDPSAPNQSWQVSLTPTNCLSLGTINFNYDGVFKNETVELKLRIINIQDGSIYKEPVIGFLPPTNTIPFSVILPKNKQFKVKVMRTGSGQNFQAYPYLFELDNSCVNTAELNMDISPAIEQIVLSSVTVECPATEVLPTLQGFYRVVWEDTWYDAEIVNGFIELLLELNGTYEVGLIIDNEMKIREYHVTDTENEIVFDLSEEECDKMGW